MEKGDTLRPFAVEWNGKNRCDNNVNLHPISIWSSQSTGIEAARGKHNSDICAVTQTAKHGKKILISILE